ncbi:hypothetical protein ACFLS1_00035 [Verrucomicrobiota bacterium]
MADVEFGCPNCAQTNIVSEYVDTNLLKCQFCGDKIDIEAEEAAEPSRPVEPNSLNSKPRLKTEVSQPQAKKKTKPRKKLWRFHNIVIKKKTIQLNNFHIITSVILFAVLASIMASMKYKGGFSDETTELINYIGPVIVAGFHVFIVILGFKDSWFNGLLCLMVPFYSFFYFFVIEGNCYLRALFGAILVAIGPHSLIVITKTFIGMLSTLYDWLTM